MANLANLNAEDGIRIWSNVEENVRKRMKEMIYPSRYGNWDSEIFRAPWSGC